MIAALSLFALGAACSDDAGEGDATLSCGAGTELVDGVARSRMMPMPPAQPVEVPESAQAQWGAQRRRIQERAAVPVARTLARVTVAAPVASVAAKVTVAGPPVQAVTRAGGSGGQSYDQ